jgi:diaminohydroxyphosphoribosylaminopyrimidine deaminase/5-amino-6-(5-phosphoribosylamino)uracil reductase
MVLNDEFYMRTALQMATATKGQTGTNPMVGCVIVKNGAIIGMGAHLRRGSHHAEIAALNMAGDAAQGAVVYVTLEPCSHTGKTPPCSSALIAAGVRRVVIAGLDPNPLVAGNGKAALEAAGIATTVGVLQHEAERLNEVFFKYIRTGLPFVAVKTASTLDGKLAARSGDSRWITGEESRAYVHALRHQYAAVMVGVNTVLADDPQLTARSEVDSVQPLRIVVDSRMRIPLHSKLLCENPERTIVLTTSAADEHVREQIIKTGARVMVCGAGPVVDLREAMRQLGQYEINSILLEGGGVLNGAMLEQKLIDKAYLFFAPQIVGGASMNNFQFAGFEKMAEAVRLHRVHVERFSDDVLITGYF